MCDPITIGAMALSTAGMMANRQSQNRAVKAQNRANQDAAAATALAKSTERTRQRGFEEEQLALQSRGQQGWLPETIEDDTAAETERTEAAFLTAADNYNAGPVAGQRPGSEITPEIAGRVAVGTQEARRRIAALARLVSGNRALGNAGMNATEATARAGTIGSFRRGSAAAAQVEGAIPAARVTPSDSPIGDLLIAAGTVGAMGAAGLPGAGAGAAPGMGATMGGPANINAFGTASKFFRPPV